MTTELSLITANLAASPEALALGYAMEGRIQELAAVQGEEPVHTYHLFHAGMYHRTIFVRKGLAMAGALLQRATTLIVSGHAELLAAEPIVVRGYAVLPGIAGRKTCLVTHEDTWFTMIVPTKAQTVEEVDREMVGDTQVMAHRYTNTVINTGVTE